jgi:hypothetical protein
VARIVLLARPKRVPRRCLTGPSTRTHKCGHSLRSHLVCAPVKSDVRLHELMPPDHRRKYRLVSAGSLLLIGQTIASAWAQVPPVLAASTPAVAASASQGNEVSSTIARIARALEVTVTLREAEQSDDRPTRNIVAQEAMVHWAKLSFLLAVVSAVVSGLGLLALLYSLRLNRRATAAAQSAVEVARETNRAQSRAWISTECVLEKPTLGTTQFGVKGIYFNVTCRARNHGRSPATGVSFHAEIALVGKDTLAPGEMMNRYCDAIRQRSDGEAEAIFPDTVATAGHMVFLPDQAIVDDIATKDFKMISPVVYGCLNYKSPYTEGIRQTRFLYHLATVDQAGRVMVLRPDQPGWLEQHIGLSQPGTVTTD